MARFSILILSMALAICSTFALKPSGTYKYISSGKSASASVEWQPVETCRPMNYVSLYASDSVFKVLGNGKPSSKPTEYVSFSMELFTDCTDTSVTRTYIYAQFPDFGGSESVAISNKFDTATVSWEGDAVAAMYDCTLDDSSWFPDCNYIQEYYVPVSITATLTGVGSSYTSRSNSWSRSDFGRYHYRYSGSSRDATVSLAVVVDGEELVIDPINISYGSMWKSKDGEIDFYYW